MDKGWGLGLGTFAGFVVVDVVVIEAVQEAWKIHEWKRTCLEFAEVVADTKTRLCLFWYHLIGFLEYIVGDTWSHDGQGAMCSGVLEVHVWNSSAMTYED